MRSMAGKFGRRFVLALAGLAVLTLAGPAAGLSDAEYREMVEDPDFRQVRQTAERSLVRAPEGRGPLEGGDKGSEGIEDRKSVV